MTACGMYASYTQSLSRSLVAADPDLSTPGTASPDPNGVAYDPARLEKMSDNLSKYEENFSRHLKILLDVLNYYAATETVRFLGLCARLSAASEGTVGAFGAGMEIRTGLQSTFRN
jgi:gamma-tubulin complex component 2